ncbi:hypothetical protein D4R42_01175 [bacterium]|nr:MAG: hypothetical protein D4R42_01175 [bacterium]
MVLNRNLIFVTIVCVILLISFGIIFSNPNTKPHINKPVSVASVDSEPFYVGVTYCGDSVYEAKQLMDKVKNYTNLFVLQSGTIQSQPDKINEICDYAVDSNLYFIVYFGSQHSNYRNNWLLTFNNQWNEKFLGVYFGDEPAGKMIDGTVNFWDDKTLSEIIKMEDGRVSKYLESNTVATYYQNNTIKTIFREFFQQGNRTFINSYYTTYYSNGTITAILETPDNEITPIDNPSATYTYEELLNLRPFQSYDETAEMFVELQQSNLLRGMRDYWNLTSFTSDYALYWFDYLSNYDVLLAQVGWNNTLAQDIALVRGSANIQNKDWGAIITWKYNHSPYLDSGEAIYEQLRTSYETGAKYAVIFNYAENMTGPYGTLQEEHFVALERFWNELVQNSDVNQGSIKSEAVLVLPENYGWGMRNPEDTIWGIWGPDEKSPQIWELSRNLLEQYGLGLDIVYDDSEFPVEGKYGQIFYWNQTS